MKQNSLEDVLRMAIDKARITMNQDIGGPFGAAILDDQGTLIALASNSVLRDHDPTSHAEINAIRLAGQQLKTHDLSGCILITTAYPCPMCCCAIVWANIKEIYYGATAKDAADIGFRDDFIYTYLKDPVLDPDLIHLHPFNREACLPLFKEYQEKAKALY